MRVTQTNLSMSFQQAGGTEHRERNWKGEGGERHMKIRQKLLKRGGIKVI